MRLTADLTTKISKLAGIGYQQYEIRALLGIGKRTWRRWFWQNTDDLGADLCERYADLRGGFVDSRQEWLDAREALAAGILFPPEDVARERRRP